MFYPVVSTISLGSHTLLDFYYHRDNVEQKSEFASTTPEEGNGTITENRGTRDIQGDEDDPSKDGQRSSGNNLDDHHFLSMLLEQRSLVLVCGEMYTQHLHGIAERTHDRVTDKIANLQNLSQPVSIGDTLQRETRVSLTIRHVPRTVKAKFLFGRR